MKKILLLSAFMFFSSADACVRRTARFIGKRVLFSLKYRFGVKKIAPVTSFETLLAAPWDEFEKNSLVSSINALKAVKRELTLLETFGIDKKSQSTCKGKIERAHAQLAFFEEYKNEL